MANLDFKKIRQLREDRGLSLSEVALLLRDQGVHVTKSAIGYWERGRHLPNSRHLSGIMSVFGVDIAYFKKQKKRQHQNESQCRRMEAK
jgi:transcriptional regulator with XRE-family HTH domain